MKKVKCPECEKEFAQEFDGQLCPYCVEARIDTEKYRVRLEKLEFTLKTLISWQVREFGEHGVKQLLSYLD